jgi:hypothetical protein
MYIVKNAMGKDTIEKHLKYVIKEKVSVMYWI